jgi:dihydroorotate dehydrogenase
MTGALKAVKIKPNISEENLVELQEIADRMHAMGIIKNNSPDSCLSELISFWLRDDL